MSTKQAIVSRPKSRTWQAYRDWVLEVTRHLNPAAKDDLSEAQWQAKATRFWSAADAHSKP